MIEATRPPDDPESRDALWDAFRAHAQRALEEGFLDGTIDDLFAVEPDGESAVRRVLVDLDERD